VYAKQIYDDGDGIDTCLECVGPVGRTMAVRRVASNDSSVAKALGAASSSAQGRNIGTIISTTNPEKVCVA
jgi:hypothetical protein